LYTDNYYTSIKLAKHLFEKCRWTLVGTIVPTDKKTREDHDIPFLKLSNGAHNQLDRGWFWDITTCNAQLGRTENRYRFFQITKLDGVTICQFRGMSEGNAQVILLVLHKRKQITLPITMPLPEMIGVVQTT
jgi:hypothetical protein